MNAFEVLIRSRSWTLAFRRGRRHFDGSTARFRHGGREVRFRVGSADAGDAVEILLAGHRSPYHLPLPAPPRTIWDIGAHVGMASLYFAARYPGARIDAFEPEPSNYVLLRGNVRGLDNVNTYRFGLGSERRTVRLVSRASFATNSFSACRESTEGSPDVSAVIVDVPAALSRTGCSRVDLIKIDTEGAEYDILSAFPDEVLAGARAVVGELHGQRDDDVLGLLERHFVVTTFNAKPEKRLVNFHAINRRQPAV